MERTVMLQLWKWYVCTYEELGVIGQYSSILCSILHPNGIPKHFIACSIK